MKKNLIPFTILIAIALGYISLSLWFKPQPIELKAATWLGDQPKQLPAFELMDHFQKPFNNQSIQGKWQLLFFGYTHCPDICPDTLQMLSNMMKQIEQEQVIEKLQLTFISVDPDRDQLDKMKAYVTYFHPKILSARGEIDKLNVLTNALGIMYQINKTADQSQYEVAHSGVLTLLNPQGQFAALFSPPHDSAQIAHDLAVLING